MNNALIPEPDEFPDGEMPTSRRSRRTSGSRLMILIRRVHLYAGLFLLPWVLLYGVTGAMFNHQGLLPEATIRPVDPAVISSSAMSEFPPPAEFAQYVVDSLQSAAPDSIIQLPENHRAEWTNPILFESHDSGLRHVVHIDPVSHSAQLRTHPENPETPEHLLGDVRNIRLTPDPHEAARDTASVVLSDAGLTSAGKPRPLGWTKLNFLASIDGQLAHITYVLKDGHVDVTRYTGEDGMTPRHFFLRLHTSHGQSPHWNGRSIWSLIVDAMAIAMVTWGLSGLVMWWQIKRTRLWGSLVLLLSITTATAMYFGMLNFYATTRL